MKIIICIILFLIIYLIFLLGWKYSEVLDKANIENWKTSGRTEKNKSDPKRDDFSDILNTKRYSYYDQVYINSVYGNQALGKLPGRYNVKTTFMDEVNAYPK